MWLASTIPLVIVAVAVAVVPLTISSVRFPLAPPAVRPPAPGATAAQAALPAVRRGGQGHNAEPGHSGAQRALPGGARGPAHSVR